MAFGPDGNLYITSFATDEVLQFDGTTGAFLGEFIPAGTGGLDEPVGLAFGLDGLIYVGDHRDATVLRYDANTGAFVDEYVTPGAGGLTQPLFFHFLANQQVTVTPSLPPTLTSSLTPGVDENQTIVQTLTATDPESDPVTFSITGGSDAALFSLAGSDQLVFDSAPDFEAPGDLDTDNVLRGRNPGRRCQWSGCPTGPCDR